MPDFDVELPDSPVPELANHEVEPEQRLAYYQRLFPFRQVFQWLNHSPSPSNDFGHREIALSLEKENGTKKSEEIYVRYQSYPTQEAFKRGILEANPTRFEIGPVYTANPRDRKSLKKSVFKPLSKELVFDIDLTDYDDVRTCCSDKAICKNCWQFITLAVKVMNAALRDDFGFQHILWVYSGRRGAHAWVCDKRARLMDDSKRRAVAGYLEVIGKGDRGKRVSLKRPLHPHLERSLDVLKDKFIDFILEGQDPWRSGEGALKLLQSVPNTELSNTLRKYWTENPSRSSFEKFRDIDVFAQKGVSKNLDTRALKNAKQDILFEYTYPRLDAEVSKHLNHLLKSPFCIHPGTGRICVPIDLDHVDDFDPLAVPTINQLLQEINNYDKANNESTSNEDRVHEYQKTSLKKYIDYFQQFITVLMQDELHTSKRDRYESLDF